MSENNDVLMSIKNIYNDLFEQEKKVADFILENSREVINMTVTELSEKSSVSDATVMRLCKKIGCSGFYSLKIALAKDMNKNSINLVQTIDSDNVNKSLENIVLYQAEQLRQLNNLLDADVVQKCIDEIFACDTLYIFGAGNTNPLAIYAAYQFSQSGIKTSVNVSPEMQTNSAFTMTSKDLCLIISDSGSTNLINDIYSIAKKQGTKIIAITSHKNSPLGKAADYVLNTINNTKLFFRAYSSSRLIHLAVIDLLVLLMLKNENSKTFKHNAEIEEYLSKYKV